MRIKKAAGNIFGADFTAAERKAIDMEIQRQLAEYDRKNMREIDAIFLWVLHEKLGLGHRRLKEFYNSFYAEMAELIRRYELEDTDNVWLCTYKLKEYGIDLEEWEKEKHI